jgi:hypothetical protein
MLLENHNAIESGGNFPISNSLRFQSASSQYLARTPASAGSRTAWTWSGWVKRGSLSNDFQLFGVYTSSTNYHIFGFNPSNQIQATLVNAGVTLYNSISSAVYRDPSSWYHIVLVFDTTQAIAIDRIKIYVNGVQITSFTTQVTGLQNQDGLVNNNQSHDLGRYGGASQYFDGYLSEVNFIDGQALTPSSFGTTDTTTGQWVAKKYTGSYGTNGFYLPFSNGTSTTTLGNDGSGNANHWTLNNFSLGPTSDYCLICFL